MNIFHSLRRRASLALLVSACACLGFAADTASVAKQKLLAGIAENGRLVLFSAASPEDVMVFKVSGLQRGETILGLDRRPLDGRIYALGSTSRIYTLDIITGRAVAVSAASFMASGAGHK